MSHPSLSGFRHPIGVKPVDGHITGEAHAAQ